MLDVTDENVVETENAEVQLPLSNQFTPRAYQIELFKCAREKNSILVLGTGSGKTFIAALLIQEFAHEIRGSICKRSKRTVFIVNTVALVDQQGSAIEKQTGLKVGQYEGSKGVDYWSDEKLAKRKAIPGKIQAMKLQPRVNGILPGFGVKKSVERELREIGYPNDKRHKLPVPEKLSDLEPVIKGLQAEEPLDGDKSDKPPTKAACFNPWEEHEVSDKSIADCTEALIGAYLLQCGADAAKDFLHWMGIGVHKGQKLLKDDLPIKTAIMQDKPWSLTEITCFYKKACLDRLEDTIQYKFKDRSFVVQAVTHPSYTQNKITNDYQRLEFIGNAVLDYLVTGLIYWRHTSYTPGQMTDLRSYYVNNETLARAAVKHELQKYLLHMSPKLQAAIDKFLQLCQEKGLERELVTEDEEDDAEVNDKFEVIVLGKNLKVAKVNAAKKALRRLQEMGFKGNHICSN